MAIAALLRSDGVNRPIGKWPSDWVDDVHDEDGGEDLLGVRSHTGVQIFKEAMYGLVCKNSIWQAWDDVSNAELNPSDVKPEAGDGVLREARCLRQGRPE